MREFLCQGESCLASPLPLLRIPQEAEHHGVDPLRADPGIVPAKDEGQPMVLLAVVTGDAFFGVSERRAQMAHDRRRGPLHMMCFQDQRWIAQLLSMRQQLIAVGPAPNDVSS